MFCRGTLKMWSRKPSKATLPPDVIPLGYPQQRSHPVVPPPRTPLPTVQPELPGHQLSLGLKESLQSVVRSHVFYEPSSDGKE